jgi:hypothetical protein
MNNSMKGYAEAMFPQERSGEPYPGEMESKAEIARLNGEILKLNKEWAETSVRWADEIHARDEKIELLNREAFRGCQTADDLRIAASNLFKTTRGRHAMRWLLGWLEHDGLGLDSAGQEAVMMILDGAWGPFAGIARDAMREYVLPYEVDRG